MTQGMGLLGFGLEGAPLLKAASLLCCEAAAVIGEILLGDSKMLPTSQKTRGSF